MQQASATDQPPDFTREPPYALGSPEERHLRANSSYLAQGWRGRARLVCYLVFGSLLTLLVVATIVALVALPSAALGVAFDSGLHPGSDVPSLVHVLTPTLATSAALAGCSLLLARVLAALTAAGVPTVLVTVVRVLGKQLKGVQEKGRPRWLTRAPGWASWVAYAVTPLVIAAVFLLLYELATRLDLTGMFVAFGAALALLTLLYLGLDPTASSLHTFYRRQLATAFAVHRVRRPGSDAWTAVERPYSERTVLSSSRFATVGRPWPRLLVCAAANISERGTTPTGRNAVPFVFSDDWVGGDEIGWIPTETFEQLLGRRKRLPTLLGGIAMSGAALSPSMGRMTSPASQLLLGLANVRLGVWLPNPRCVEAVDPNAEGTTPPVRAQRRPRITWLVRELMGWNALDARHVYVTDGAHFDNLGLLELLRRRCTEIYCFDASGDPPDTFTTLAQTLAMARTELKVEIPLDPASLRDVAVQTAAGRPLARSSWITVDFAYPPVDGQTTTGRLVYVECRVTADAAWDVVSLYERDDRFPNHSTADQLYTEERFEAYRKLGEQLAGRAMDGMEAGAVRARTAPSRSRRSAPRSVHTSSHPG